MALLGDARPWTERLEIQDSRFKIGDPRLEISRLEVQDSREDRRTKTQVRSFMPLLKSPSPLKIAANRGSQAGVRGSRRMTVNLRGQSVDSTMVVSPVAQPKKPRHDELKGLIELTGHVFSKRWTTFSGFAGPPRRGDADLLIGKGLLARLGRRGGERLLNLKDLLRVLPPSLQRLFENGPVLTPLFWCRIVPNSAIFCQNVAEYGIKSTFSATDFIGTGQALRLGSHPNERRTQIGHQAESITSAPQQGLAGRRSDDFTSGSASCIGTNMVELRKLTRGDLRHFHHPYHGFAGKPVLKTNWLSERVSVFGRFLGYQILPNFTNFYQKRAANGREQADKG